MKLPIKVIILLLFSSMCVLEGADNIPSPANKEHIREEIAKLRASIEAISIEAKKDPITFELKQTYREKYDTLNESEKEYLKKNFPLIRRITQSVLTQLAPKRVPSDIHTNERNVVEFYLYSDGSISDQRCVVNSNYPVLENVSLEVIDLASKKYPRPLQKTLIRYSILYKMGG